MRKETPLAVELPSPDRDRPAWVKVGLIAAVGFIVGVAWPRVVGVRLGPSAPGESAAVASGAPAARAPEAPTSVAANAAPGAVATASALDPTAAPAARAATPAAKASGPPKITIAKGSVLSCKTREGETKSGKDCGPVTGLDLVVRPGVRNIATCAGADGQTGKLALVVNADFVSGSFSYDVGRTSTVQDQDAIRSCLKRSFEKTTIATGVPHEHPRYRVSYTATLGGGSKEDSSGDTSAPGAVNAKAEKPAEKPTDDPPPKPAPIAAAGEAVVAWEVALVRDTPKVGAVVARLPRGTKVKLGASKEGWYSVKFGDGFGEGGWVYRGAIGR
jgi:hypothetical protein